MDSPMKKMLLSRDPNKSYPSNLGKKWYDDEDALLMEELNNNIDIEIIAQKHNRTLGGIKCRCGHIAYNMYLQDIPMEEIIEKTHLDEQYIKQIIDKKTNKYEKTNKIDKNKSNNINLIENEIIEMKKDIKEIKNNVNELVSMMKAVYEFEDS